MAVEAEGSRFTVVCDSDHLDASGVPELVARISEATTRISEATAHKIEASARKIEVWAHEFRPRGSQTSEQADKKIGLYAAEGVDHQPRLCYCHRNLGYYWLGSRHRLVYRRP